MPESIVQFLGSIQRLEPCIVAISNHLWDTKCPLLGRVIDVLKKKFPGSENFSPLICYLDIG